APPGSARGLRLNSASPVMSRTYAIRTRTSSGGEYRTTGEIAAAAPAKTASAATKGGDQPATQTAPQHAPGKAVSRSGRQGAVGEQSGGLIVDSPTHRSRMPIAEMPAWDQSLRALISTNCGQCVKRYIAIPCSDTATRKVPSVATSTGSSSNR